MQYRSHCYHAALNRHSLACHRPVGSDQNSAATSNDNDNDSVNAERVAKNCRGY